MAKLVFLFIVFNLQFCSTEEKVKNRHFWDAFPANSYNLFEYKKDIRRIYKYIIIHHSGFSKDFDIKQIQLYHIFQKNYGDIGYHFIIDDDGEIYQGRLLKYIGAHAGQSIEANKLAEEVRSGKSNKNLIDALKLDPDYGAIGICLLGDFDKGSIKPTKEQLNSLSQLLLKLSTDFNIEKSNILRHNKYQHIFSKKNKLIAQTVCPGKNACGLIDTVINSLKIAL